MKRITLTISVPVPACALAAARAVAPVLSMVRAACVRGWIAVCTWGMHPAAPYHRRYAVLRAASRGGVRL